MAEFFKSILDSYKDRIKSPLIGSFVLTFLVANWKSIAILFFSHWPIHCRIEWIDDRFDCFKHFWIPLLLALMYVLILPYINIGIDYLLSKHSNYKDNKTDKTRTRELTQRKKEAKLLREIADEQAGTSEILILNNKIANLTDEINNLNKTNQLEIERYKSAEAKQSEMIKSLQNEAVTLTNNENTYKNQIKEMRYDLENKIIPNPIKITLDDLSKEEKRYYVDFCNFKIFNITRSIRIDLEMIEKFLKLELMEGEATGNEFKITHKGEFVYYLCKNLI